MRRSLGAAVFVNAFSTSPGPGLAMRQPDALSEAPLPLFADARPAGGPALPSYLRDHRKRLRARFLEGGAGAVPDSTFGRAFMPGKREVGFR